MITYVNTVLVGKGKGAMTSISSKTALKYNSSNVGKIIVVDADTANAVTADSKAIKLGLVTNKKYATKDGNFSVVKWTNPIKKDGIKSYVNGTYKQDEQEYVDVHFNDANVLSVLAEGNKRVVLKLTFKDLPTRYRKWTESYEYVTKKGDDGAAIVKGLAKAINDNFKRARVSTTISGDSLGIYGLNYDDDDVVDSISWDNTVRFSVNVWYTDPQATGFASKNKYSAGCFIEKVPAKKYAASAKLVRDREAMGMGYLGILNRGECTWPVIKPDMNVDLDAHYDYITLEWENRYRSADDLNRLTKESVEIYDLTGTLTAIKSAIDKFINGEPASSGATENPSTKG